MAINDHLNDHNERNAKPKCPKGLKIHAYIKGQAALMSFKTKADRNYFLRSMGVAMHDAANRAKNAKIKMDSAE